MDEDQQWIAKLTQGELDGFNQLYQKYSGQIYGFFKNRISDSDLVADLHQMTWERVYKKAHLFNLNQKFSPWLYTIASHIMIDEIRKKTRLIKFKEDYSELNEADVQPEKIAEDFDRLNQLSDLNKKIIEMRYLDEKSFLEISKELNLKEANVRKIISRALKILKGRGL